MKVTLTVLFLVCAGLLQAPSAVAQSAATTIPASAESAEGFIAPGWSLEHRIDNDLDSDGLDDLVLIVRQNHDQASAQDKSFDVMRRRILIAFRHEETSRYRLVQQDTRLIPQRETVNVESYLPADGALEGVPKGFAINLELFMSAGGWETEMRTFRFEYRKGSFVLVAFDSQRTHRASGETTGLRLDFPAGLAVKSSGNIEDDETRVVTEKLNTSRVIRLQDIGPAFDFNPVQ